MRISQLAAETAIPVATIKFYLREKLLHDGELTSPTQAQYDDSHVQRLRLVRALLGPGGLSVAAARELLQQVSDPPESGDAVLGVAHHAVNASASHDVDLTAAQELVQHYGWRTSSVDRGSQAALANALQGLDAAGFELADGAMDLYARVMHEVAEFELAHVPTESTEAAVRYVVMGTVLVEPLLLALRRLAQQDAAARRFDLEA